MAWIITIKEKLYWVYWMPMFYHGFEESKVMEFTNVVDLIPFWVQCLQWYGSEMHGR